MKRQAKWFLLGLVLTCGAIAGYAIGMTRAEGIPGTGALTYSGILEDVSLTPLTGNKNVQVALWDAVSGGNKLCETSSQPIALVRGRFEVVLPDDCVDQVKTKADTWVEVIVDGAPLPRAKIGAVPYAVEAGHAMSADSATGALEQRISALENQTSGKVAGIWSAAAAACASTPQGQSWTDVPETTVSFQVSKPVKIWSTYSINVQPDGNPGTEYLGTHLTVDGSVAESSASQFQPLTSGDSNMNINGNYVADLEAGSHTVMLQWARASTIGAPTVTWRNCPTWDINGASVAGRTVVVIAVYR
jgi:hypothetical protein